MFQPLPTRALAAVAAALVLGVAGCGTPQTLIPYNQAEGVTMSHEVNGSTVPLKLGNLLVVNTGEGEGFVAGTIVSPVTDTLIEIGGAPLMSIDEPGQPFDTTRTDLALPANTMTNLLQENVTVASPDLVVGHTAELTLSFAKAGQVTLAVPVVDGDKPDYRSYRPSAPASAPVAPEAAAPDAAAPDGGAPSPQPTP